MVIYEFAKSRKGHVSVGRITKITKDELHFEVINTNQKKTIPIEGLKFIEGLKKKDILVLYYDDEHTIPDEVIHIKTNKQLFQNEFLRK